MHTSHNIGLERPALTLIVPDTHFFVGEELYVQVFPPLQDKYEIEICGPSIRETKELESNSLTLNDLSAGKYRLRSRYFCKAVKDQEVTASEWSLPLDVTYHEPAEESLVNEIRLFQHNLSLICEKDVNGVVMITDPMAQPPSCPDSGKVDWFKTACYEGSTMLLNEESDYYRDPLQYYFDVLDAAVDKGVSFVTWGDIIADNFDPNACNLLIQFDVDAGPKSMECIIHWLLQRKIRFTVMVHREAHDWYSYNIDDMDISLLKEAEKKGCDVGYHNNSLSNVQRRDRVGNYGPEILAEASKRFEEDVRYLRKYFKIQIFTHHGGNSLNLKIPVPEGLDIMCVDKPFNSSLWEKINSSFSDGGFLARPCSLRKKIKGYKSGVHFIRTHPVKYANYSQPYEILPSDPADAVKAGLILDSAFWRNRDIEMAKQRKWLSDRKQYRMARRFSYACEHKPISRGFRNFLEIKPIVEGFRSVRRSTFLRQYPSALGDPRVFWWRMLDSYAPLSGEVLNVGALPPGQKDEMTAFLSEDVKVLEMDIDSEREPDLLCDITQADSKFNGRFDGVLLFGLPYIHSPSLAVEACLRLTKPGGVAMFGFASDTHPFRGGMWKPDTRPVFRKDLEPLKNIGLKGNLWSFDKRSVEEMFSDVSGIVVEFFFHYWFILCNKGAS